MNRIARFALVALAIGFAAPARTALAQAAAKPVIAILPFAGTAGTAGGDARDSDGLSRSVADFLARDMAANSDIRVVEREPVQRLADVEKRASRGQVGQEVAVRIGRLLGAQHVVFGSFTSDPAGNFRIDARAVNVETGRIEHTERVQDRADNVMPLVAQLAARLDGGMHLPASPARSGDRTLAASTALPMKYAVMYGKALELADKGDTARAIELFGAVLKDYPDFAPAQTGLRKLQPGA